MDSEEDLQGAWNRSPKNVISSMATAQAINASVLSLSPNLLFLVTATEGKAWVVPKHDARNMERHRHAREMTFPDYTPTFLIHVKALWASSFENESRQQPTRPAGIESTGERNLCRTSINSGWEHLRATFHAMSKVQEVK